MSVATPVIDYLDPASKKIYLLAGTREYHPITDIYHEIRNIRKLNPDTRRWFDMPVFGAGAVPKGGGKFTPRYAIFNHGWQVVPEDTPHELYISGEQITDDGQSGPACIDISGLTSSVIIQYEPPSAELIQAAAELAAIQDMAFFGAVWFNSMGSNTGTIWPAGTQAEPCSVYDEAKIIETERKKRRLQLLHNLTMVDTDIYDNYSFIGAGMEISKIVVPALATINDCYFETAEVEGTIEGKSRMERCLLLDISGLQGRFFNCVLGGTIKLNTTGIANFYDSNSNVPGIGTPIIDYNGTGSCSLRGFKGGSLHTNKTGPEAVSIDLQSGQVKIDLLGNFGDSPVNNGFMVVRGEGKVIEATTGEVLNSGTHNINFELLNETSLSKTAADNMWLGTDLVKP